MFSDTPAFSGFSVSDLDAAEKFYSEVLGLSVTRNEMGFLNLHLKSGAVVMVYPKREHTPASFTSLNFDVDDVETAVDELNARGVTTKIYDDIPSDSKGIMRGHGPDIAWFKDPSNNVISVVHSG